MAATTRHSPVWSTARRQVIVKPIQTSTQRLPMFRSLDRFGPVMIWGSSYTGALIFQLATKNPGAVDGLMAFSPSADEPLKDCLEKD